jgi:hypothetical protein
MLQVGRSRVLFPVRALDLSIYLIFPSSRIFPEVDETYNRMSTRSLVVGKAWPARKDNNLTAIYESTV